MEDWGEEIFAEGVGVKWKNERVGRGRGRKNTPARRKPAGLVRLQNPYTRWTGPLIGAVGCNLIDACHLQSFFSSGRSTILCDLERKWRTL